MRKAVMAVLIAFSLSALGFYAAGTASSQAAELNSAAGRFDEIYRAYGSLSDREKNSIYKIDSKIRKQITAILYRYAELGVISEDEAEEMSSRYAKRSEASRERDFPLWLMPGAGRKLADDPQAVIERSGN